MSEQRNRGKPSTAASEWLVEFLNLDFKSRDHHESQRIAAFLSHDMPPPTRQTAHNIQIEVKAVLSQPQLKERLYEVAGALNDWGRSGKVKPQWQAETHVRNLEGGQAVYRFGRERITFRPWRMIEHGIKNSSFIALAYLLESGQLARLRKCTICSRFFFARDFRKNVCSRECGREKDKPEAAKRVKRSRQKRAKIEKQKGVPELVKVADSSFEALREMFGEKVDDFVEHYAQPIRNGAQPKEVWDKLPPRFRKPLLVRP